MVSNTTYGKHFMTIVLYNRNNVLVQPISPAFVNQTEPVLNRKHGMYVYLCVCVWHLFFFGASLWDAGGSCVLFLPNVASLRDALSILCVFFFFFLVMPFISVDDIRHELVSNNIFVIQIDEFYAFHIL